MVLAFPLTERAVFERLRGFNESPTLTLELLLGSDLDTVEHSFVFDVRDYSAQGGTASVTLGFEPILDLSIPQLNYAPYIVPGLFSNISAADF